MARAPFEIGGTLVRPGTRKDLGLPITRLVTGDEVSFPLRVLHGRTDGPTVWLSAAIHGDEVCGVEIIRRVLEELDPKRLAGTVIAVPIVNVYGFINGDRYLPDRRDLNRSFPGSPRGSLASRIAHLMMTEVVAKCSVGIDLHTGSDHRTNLPQIRGDLDDQRTRELAETFGAPVIYHARIRDGSLRHAAAEAGATVLLYEAGEAWRFDEWAIVAGVAGVRRVLADLSIFDYADDVDGDAPPIEVRKSSWVRATRTGIVHMECELGAAVAAGERIAVISDSFGKRLSVTKAHRTGIVIGRTEAPLVNRGDALVHIGETA